MLVRRTLTKLDSQIGHLPFDPTSTQGFLSAENDGVLQRYKSHGVRDNSERIEQEDND